jgi:hypothetical protein
LETFCEGAGCLFFFDLFVLLEANMLSSCKTVAN